MNNLLKIEDLEIAIVAPLHIPPTQQWVEALKYHSAKKNRTIYIVDDSPLQDIYQYLPDDWILINREYQEGFLGDRYESFKQFHKSSSCKNIGHLIAYKEGADIIIGVDSDCVVPMDFIGKHIEGLIKVSHGWTNPIGHTGFFSRGYPYAERNRKTICNLGLWNNELDLYGTDRIGKNPPKEPKHMLSHQVADGFIPLSGMNWAMWREAIPGFLFLPNFEFEDNKFRRHDDIWGGYIFQKLMEKRNERIVFGDPVVYHDTTVVPEEDAEEEKGMIAFENTFYGAVDQAMDKVKPGSYLGMFYDFYLEIKDKWKGTEFEPLIDAIKFWTEVWE